MATARTSCRWPRPPCCACWRAHAFRRPTSAGAAASLAPLAHATASSSSSKASCVTQPAPALPRRRLDVGSETGVDRSKSVMSYLLAACGFSDAGNTSVQVRRRQAAQRQRSSADTRAPAACSSQAAHCEPLACACRAATTCTAATAARRRCCLWQTGCLALAGTAAWAWRWRQTLPSTQTARQHGPQVCGRRGWRTGTVHGACDEAAGC